MEESHFCTAFSAEPAEPPRTASASANFDEAQVLIAVGGEGLYQEKGKTARKLRSGDVVEIAPNVVHWHGAAPDSWFSHLAVECNPQTNKNTWLESVSDAEYENAAKNAK